MARFVVVTGTDTGVGKTVVSCGLAVALAARGKRVVAIKPFETGVGPGDSGDAEALAAATGQDAPKAALVRLRDPLAPALAADNEGVTLDFHDVIARIRAAAAGYDFALVEGAGGVLSPLTWTTDIPAVAHALGEETVVLVAADRLGTLSAAHAAVQCLADSWLVPAAIVLAAPAAPDASTGTNAGALRRRLAPYGKTSERVVELGRVGSPAEAAGALAGVAAWLDVT
jgi:dethiobiotin synthetase